MNGFTRKVVGAAVVSATLLLGATGAMADTVPFSGSASVEVPPSPAGEMGFTLTVNGQEHDFSNVDNSLGGRLTLTWVGSQDEPRATTQDCPNGAPGKRILLEEASPSATLWATWVSPTSNETIGPVQVPTREGFAAAELCVADRPPAEDPEEDPTDPVEDPEPVDEPEGEPSEDPKEKKDKDKPKDKPKS